MVLNPGKPFENRRVGTGSISRNTQGLMYVQPLLLTLNAHWPAGHQLPHHR